MIWSLFHYLINPTGFYVSPHLVKDVSVLLNKGDRLFESDLVMRFVDELRGPEASLLGVCGADAFQQAADLAGKFFKPAHSILFKPKLADDEEETVSAFREACISLCTQLSLADLVLFPMLDRLEAVLAQLKGIAPESVIELQSTEADSSDYPELVRYLCRMRSLPFVATLRQPVRLQAMFAATMRAGQANPDI
ncbi:Glutathione dehydrogenase [Paragonimus kellicotti]|nr:Glutathione dehydrogenase [Paragonimus kellicotti]